MKGWRFFQSIEYPCKDRNNGRRRLSHGYLVTLQMEIREPVNIVASSLGLAPTGHSYKEVLEQLVATINELIDHDFNKLVSILYRMDINENKLRLLLNENKDQDAGLFIANMMIERELQKIRSRRDSGKYGNSQRDNDIDENEKW